MVKKVVGILWIAVSCSIYANAQEISHRIQKKYREAQVLISQKKYDAAIHLLKECTLDAPQFTNGFQVLADVLRKNKRYKEALQAYQKVIDLDPDLSALTYFGIAESAMACEKYQEAITHFTTYIDKKPNSTESIEKAKKYISDCEFAVKAIQNPISFSPQNIGENINSKNEEYLPALTADSKTLLFTRRISANEDFYISTKENDKWSFSIPLKGAINTSQNEGSQTITPDGRYLFFAGCNRPDGLGRCDIYMSSNNSGEWTAAQNLGSPVNTAAWESQPSITADGNTLYFVSNRAGGLGGNDIWKSTLQNDGSWSDPENLGPQINTKYDEMSPYIHPDGQTLYFASNGWPGMGNKDIFMSKMDEDGNWSKPKNLGYPLNTFEEESGFIVSADGKNAYFAANRNDGFGKLDIYEIILDKSAKPEPVSYVQGKVIDKDSKEILVADAQVIDLKSNKIVYNNVTDPSNGGFLAVMPAGGNYALFVSKEGYIFYSENFELEKSNPNILTPFEIEVSLEKIKNNAQTILKNIFFATNQFNLLPLSLIELEKLNSFLKLNPKVTIQIEGHTDNVGNDELNDKLSLNRAKAVYEYLISKGIDKNRLNFEGFGKNKPIATNETEKGRQLNRRTAFKIMSF